MTDPFREDDKNNLKWISENGTHEQLKAAAVAFKEYDDYLERHKAIKKIVESIMKRR